MFSANGNGRPITYGRSHPSQIAPPIPTPSIPSDYPLRSAPARVTCDVSRLGHGRLPRALLAPLATALRCARIALVRPWGALGRRARRVPARGVACAEEQRGALALKSRHRGICSYPQPHPLTVRICARLSNQQRSLHLMHCPCTNMAHREYSPLPCACRVSNPRRPCRCPWCHCCPPAGAASASATPGSPSPLSAAPASANQRQSVKTLLAALPAHPVPLHLCPSPTCTCHICPSDPPLCTSAPVTAAPLPRCPSPTCPSYHSPSPISHPSPP